jgi:hypothetical protein
MCSNMLLGPSAGLSTSPPPAASSTAASTIKSFTPRSPSTPSDAYANDPDIVPAEYTFTKRLLLADFLYTHRRPFIAQPMPKPLPPYSNYGPRPVLQDARGMFELTEPRAPEPSSLWAPAPSSACSCPSTILSCVVTIPVHQLAMQFKLASTSCSTSSPCKARYCVPSPAAAPRPCGLTSMAAWPRSWWPSAAPVLNRWCLWLHLKHCG